MNCEHLIRQLCRERKLTHKQWERLFSEYDDGDVALATELAREIAISRFGKRLWFRGIVEFSNICKQNCLYCGIRRESAEKAQKKYQLHHTHYLMLFYF